MRTSPSTQVALLLTVAIATRAQAAEPSLVDARRLLLRGSYAEAQEQFAALELAAPAPAALGQARCLFSQGKRDEAIALLTAASEKHKDAQLFAELAIAGLTRGDYAPASEYAESAIKLDRDCLPARWVQAELLRLAGRMREADQAYKWFVDYYNRRDKIDDVEHLYWIGQGAAQFARWNRLSDQFQFLVNELYPDAAELDADYWPAHFEAGLLFLEKYNEPDAAAEFKKALAINPNAAEVHAALAALAIQNYELVDAQKSLDRALEINPEFLWAAQLQADIHLANFEPQRARAAIDKALKLNPGSEESLGRLAAIHAALGETAELQELIEKVAAQNSHCGEFFFDLAAGLDRLRRFPLATKYFRECLDRMPQHASARGELGLMLMRMGDETEAARVLNESFDVDPFNVRVSNSIKVLDVLADYAVLESDHFVLKFDRARDELLARYASKYLEDHVYPEICEQLGHEPEGKTLIEIFNRSRNTDGHGWFSARMVGLPNIGTVGACAGGMVAMQSPSDGQKFGWARVLKHEFVHVVNLQQTNFNIPHWFTEALAVHFENLPRPPDWNTLLAARFAEKSLFNLGTINRGFIRPPSSDDWTLAYCQAELYADYMLARFGDQALKRMLDAYGRNLDTPAAIEFMTAGVKLSDFERGYDEYVAKIVAEVGPSDATGKIEFTELDRQHREEPDNSDVAARLAHVYLRRGLFDKAREAAESAAAHEPTNQLAAYVLARLEIRAGKQTAALERLEAALDREKPQQSLLALLAGLKLKAEQFAEAARLYELGREHFPHDPQWTQALARVYLKSGEEKQLRDVLPRLADLEPDDPVVRKKLAEIALKAGEFGVAADWAEQALRIDVVDADAHRQRAEALLGQGDAATAVEEFSVAVELAPKQLQLRFALADAAVQAKQSEKARTALEELIKLEADYPGAAELLESLEE